MVLVSITLWQAHRGQEYKSVLSTMHLTAEHLKPLSLGVTSKALPSHLCQAELGRQQDMGHAELSHCLHVQGSSGVLGTLPAAW